MSCMVQSLAQKRLLHGQPRFLAGAVQYEVIMGSVAYGVSSDTSDMDIYGFCIPPRDEVFPHLRGEIPDFDPPAPRFEQFQQHHILDRDALGGRGREYDLTIYAITKYFRLCLENNPNLIDSLFVPRNCVLYSTPLGELVRENRHRFLHKGCWPKFKGYAFAQMHKLRSKQPQGKRRKTVERFGYDVKFGYHVVRLLHEVEQLLTEQDLQLDRNREQLKAIRRGECSLAQLQDYVQRKETELETAYSQSKLPALPERTAIKALLLHCLEEHYGSLDGCINQTDSALQALRDIDQVLSRVRGLWS